MNITALAMALSIAFTSLTGAIPAHVQTETPTAILERFEEEYAIIELATEKDIYYIDVLYELFNEPVEDDQELALTVTPMICHGQFKDINGNTYYQFRSYDDCIWWLLTESELGFVPDRNAVYNCYYLENGTWGTNEDAREDDIFLLMEGVN